MKKYKITDIIEDEFGCEGRPEGEEPMVTILLVDDTGKQRSIRMADKLAYEKKLDIGAEEDYKSEQAREFVAFWNNGSLKQFITAFYKDEPASKDEIEELRNAIEELEE